MNVWKWIVGALVAIVAGLGFAYLSADKDTRNLLANLPTNRDVLFWTIPQRDAGFRALDAVPIVAKSHVIAAGGPVYPLPKGEPIEISVDVDAYMQEQRTAGLVIVQDGKVRLEKYGLDFDASG